MMIEINLVGDVMKKTLFLAICTAVCVFVCSGCDNRKSATVDIVNSDGGATRVTATEVSSNHCEVSTNQVSPQTRQLEAVGRLVVWAIYALAGGGGR